MIKTKHIFAAVSVMVAFGTGAQGLNTEITVTHEVVPEEQAATRMRRLPSVVLPELKPAKLAAMSSYVPAEFTPYINSLSAAQYADSTVVSPRRGYAVLAYGPTYNLSTSAGYRFVNTETLALDAYMQFDGMSYTSKYPGIDYDGRVCFRRNSALAGAGTTWNAGSGTLDASLLYQYSGFNFPILDLPTFRTDHYSIDANVVKAQVGWGSRAASLGYRVNVDYDMIYFGAHKANNNRVALTAGLDRVVSKKSTWSLDVAYSIDHSAIAGNKGLLHLLPKYSFGYEKLTFKIGADVDITTGNCKSSPAVMAAPDVDVVWQPWTFMQIWGKVSGRMDDNSRSRLFDEQPYLLADFDAGFSRIYSGDAGLTFGPFRGARIDVFGGYMMAYDWYMPSIVTGYMTAMDVKGLHGGAALSYDYRQYLSLNFRAEFAESPRGNYSRGYALWRDHAKMNFTARAAVRPIDRLEITLSYHLRTGRQKQLPADNNLDLRAISDLQAGASYRITPQWSAFISGENLLNRHWYLGPAVPAQGIMGMIGATYKF